MPFATIIASSQSHAGPALSKQLGSWLDAITRELSRQTRGVRDGRFQRLRRKIRHTLTRRKKPCSLTYPKIPPRRRFLVHRVRTGHRESILLMIRFAH